MKKKINKKDVEFIKEGIIELIEKAKTFKKLCKTVSECMSLCYIIKTEMEKRNNETKTN